MNSFGFLHRTVHDFIAAPDTYALLQRYASPEFDASISLCKLSLALLKMAPSGEREHHLGDLRIYQDKVAARYSPSDQVFLIALGLPDYFVNQAHAHQSAFSKLTETDDSIMYVEPSLNMTFGFGTKSLGELAVLVKRYAFVNIPSDQPREWTCLLERQHRDISAANPLQSLNWCLIRRVTRARTDQPEWPSLSKLSSE